MQLSLLKDTVIYTCVLPKKQKGKYWITQRNDQNYEENIISVEGIEGNWILKSNKQAVILDDNRSTVKEIAVEPMNIYHIHLTRTDEYVVLFSEPVSADRNTFKKLRLPASSRITIGRAESCDLHYANKYTSSIHAELLINGAIITIQDQNSANGTFVNGERVTSKVLRPGDVIYIIGLRMIMGLDFIAVNNPDGQLKSKNSVFYPYIKQAVAAVAEEEEELEEISSSQDWFYRSPRFKRDIKKAEFVIDPPPSLGNMEQLPIMLMLGPSITMGMASLFTGLFTLQTVLNTGGSVRNAMPTLVMSVSMLLGTILWPILARKHESKRRRLREQNRNVKYKEYLEHLRLQIAEECVHQSDILHENLVTVGDCITRIEQQQRNLWERTRTHNDFLTLRLGLGAVALQAEIKHPEKRFTLDEDELQEELNTLIEEPKFLNNVPLPLSLTEDWVTGIIGNREATVTLTKQFILQLTALHSYDELKLVFLYDTKEQGIWEFVKWLPHVWNEEGSLRFVASRLNEVKELSAYLEKELSSRENLSSDEAIQDVVPYYVIIAADRHLAGKAEIINGLLKQKKNLGFSILHLYDQLMNLPKECSLVIECDGENSKIYDKDDISGNSISFCPDPYETSNELALAVHLANIRLDTSGSKYNLPDMLTFLDMFEVGKVEHLNALTRWKDNDPVLSLETPIGVDTSGALFNLDLHEKFHGPHGLIAGMTGSGKSEFIMTYILSLAVNYHPQEVAFILIDYKGGGMASAFTGLPHLVGTITNLDGAAVKRSLISIQSELKRRQSIFQDINSRLGLSNIDIYKYQKLFREGQVTEPLQHLFIISDEFAELKTQQPEFMEQLVSAARIGRSLGIHLILATQKPAGVVDDQIWSNSKFRISLKVQERADSMDVIKRPDAAELSVTGRFYIQVGFNELFELGQSAWAGAPYYPADRMEQTKDQSLTVVDNLGRIVKQVAADKRKRRFHNPSKQINKINEYLSQIAVEEGIKVRPLWLEPIPAVIYLDELKKKYPHHTDSYGDINPVIGEVDDPVNQRQLAMTFPLSRDGNAIIYGAAGSGKTVFMTTLITSLIEQHTPNEINMYILDFGSETLGVFSESPHVGDVMFSHDTEKVNNLFQMLQRKIVARKKRFSPFGGDFRSYNRSCTEQEPSITVIIHNYSAFTELFEGKEESISLLSREGVKYGIYFVLTALNTGAVRYKTLQNFKQLFVLQLNDSSDYSGVLGNVDGIYPSKLKGRGIFKTDNVYEFQLAHIQSNGGNVLSELRSSCSSCANQWMGNAAERVPILPDKVDLTFLKKDIHQRKDGWIPVGVEKESLEVSYMDFSQSYIQLVLSRDLDMTAFVQGLVEVLAEKGTSKLLVFDAEGRFMEGRRDHYRYVDDQSDAAEKMVIELFNTLVKRNNAFKDAMAAGQPVPAFEKLTVIVLSVSALMSKLSEDAKNKWKVLLDKGDTAYQVHFVLAERAAYIATISYEAWYKEHVAAGEGIWIGDGFTDQYQLKTARFANEMYREIGDDFGYVLHRGKAVLVKLLSSSALGEEAVPVG
ncbi:type VII secretion protein EssC [Paenibacillus wynnii]|uniref:type VII secretion protein EssC n=1 Tax=Paenibacillus wynnii TaxID=268407 RepID=UPI0027D8BC2F|nr:type VII secretion protein EssC [Paenibacillus wynnii]